MAGVQFFLGYARRDWNADPEALGLFYDQFCAQLKRPLGDDFVLYRDTALREQSGWETQLRQEITVSEALVINFSRCWLESSVCWDEYHFARARGIQRDRVFVILYDPEGLEKAVMPKAFAQSGESPQDAAARFKAAKAEMIAWVRRDQQMHFDCGYRQAMREASMQAARQDHMNALVDPLVKVIAARMDEPSKPDTPAPTLRTPLEEQGGQAGRHSRRIGTRDVAFAEIPAGSYTCLRTGARQDIAAPFLIMREPMTARDLFGAPAAAALTFDRLLFAGEGLPEVPDGFSLPSEAEWEHAMRSGAVVPPTGHRREATRSLWSRAGSADVLAVKGQNIVLKSGPPEAPARSRLSARTKVGATPLRLVIREDRG